MQQGFFGLSYQIGAACFLFTGAMTPLLTREFSVASYENDLKKMAILFRRYIPLLYSVAAYFSCFIAVQAGNIIDIMGGNEYKGAILALVIMAFYPIHQTYGQLSGSVFYAMGQTKQYRNIGVFFALIGVPVTYFLIAPKDKLGIDAGAMGLAVKTVVLQIVAVNVQLYYNTRVLRLSFGRYLGHQIVSVVCMLIMAFIATKCVLLITGPENSAVLNFFFSGILYTLSVLVLLKKLPIIFGLKSKDVQSVINKITGLMKS